MISIPHLSRNEQRRRLRRHNDRRNRLRLDSHSNYPHRLLQALPPPPPPIALALLPGSEQLAIVEQPFSPSTTVTLAAPQVSSSSAVVTLHSNRPRRTRRKAKNCRNLSRYGHDFAGFRGVTVRESLLETDLARMQQQIYELEQTRVLMQSIQLVRHANASGLVADKVFEYYQHFARGYDPAVNGDHGALLESLLRSIMMDDVESPAFRSLDMFLLQWKNYSRYHAAIALDVASITPLASDDPTMYLIKVEGVTTLRISRDTITHFFKPLLHDEALVQRLIGREYAFSFVTLFYFNVDGRVFKMEPRADLASGLFTLMSDPLATVKLLGASQLSDDGCLHAYTESEETAVDHDGEMRFESVDTIVDTSSNNESSTTLPPSGSECDNS